MKRKQFRLLKVMFLVLVLTLTMAACDTTNEMFENEEETGSLAITAEANLESEAMEALTGQSDEMGTQNIPEERFEDYKLTVTIENEAGETDEKTSDPFDSLDDEVAVEFKDLYVGEWTVTDVKLQGDYNYDDHKEDDVTIGSNSKERSVTVTSDRVNSVDVTVDDQSLGGLKVSVDNLPQEENVNIEIGDEDANFNSSDKNYTWKELEPRMTTLKINSKALDGEQKRKVMVVPGLTKELTVHFSEGDAEVNVDFALAPSIPTDVEAELNDDDNIDVTWDEPENIDSITHYR
ncbi:MAG: hypothetical protein ACOC1S_04625, partial [bacterium]